MSTLVTELACVACERKFQPTPDLFTCPECPPGEGILDIDFDIEAVRNAWDIFPLDQRQPTHWRYRELLPLDENEVPHDWMVGWTPVIDAHRLAAELGVARVLLKDEGRNPTASFKDRASSVGVAHALERNSRVIACASTGNAATSLAGHAALAGIAAVIFVPHTAPESKLAQLLVFGAKVLAVEGTYDEAYRLCWDACDQFGWYNRNCAINPVLVEGKKTAGLEIAEQCHSLRVVPDWVAVSVGDGCTLAGIWKGLVEMQALGYGEQLPRLLGVQGTHVAPIAFALEHGQLPSTCEGSTIADSIDVPIPRNWRKAVRALRQSDGTVVRVTDDQILAAMRLAGRHGVFAEPAAAAALAGIHAALDNGTIRPDESILVMITGSGLKDTRSATLAGGEPIRIKPDLEVLSAIIHTEL